MEIEVEGRTTEEAIAEACRQLNQPREMLEIQVITPGSTGIFGIVGTRKARVRARLKGSAGAAGEPAAAKGAAKPSKGGGRGKRPARGRQSAKARDLARAEEMAGETPVEEISGEPEPGEELGEEREPERGREAGQERDQGRDQERGRDQQAIEPARERRPRRRRPRRRRPAAAAAPHEGEPEPGAEPDIEGDFEPDFEAPEAGGAEELELTGEAVEAAVAVAAAGAAAAAETPAVMASEEVTEAAAEACRQIVAALGYEAIEVQVTRLPGEARLELVGEDAAALIGHRGDVLNALQHVISKIANRQTGSRTTITVDAEGWRSRRGQALEELALKLARKAKETGKPVAMSPMNAHDRRVVHLALQGDTELTTRSRGDGALRKVVIFPRRARRGRGEAKAAPEESED